ncbi:MAG: 50S ribosome-binding GTPase [Oscillospiraceae bacterium]|nr:50S ribosome-binding GTPase [Oscillospiraceae bacterium]MBQ9111821.1 50S ribosome-binding GTPase [Oscillospiraceae bacterium]
MTIDTGKMVQDCMNAINERIRNLKHLNIIVAGKTGVGKSTLINSIFRENLADTGIGMPVTGHMKQYSKKNFPLSIYDTRGFELGKDAQKEVKQEILDTIRKGHAAKDINQAIHCIWYCINTASDRIEPEEIDWLRDFAEENQMTQVPVILVLTKSFSKKNAKQMRDCILNENLSVCQVVPVLAADYEIDEDYTVKAYGLDTLIEVMTQVLPDELQDTLQNVQIASLEQKKRRAHAAVAAATTAAFGEGFAPIPFADAALLVPTQVTMIASITAIFGLNVSRSIITGFVSSTLGAGGATILGRTIVANLVKLIPGAGTAAGGMISGATAGLLTTALGEAYIQLMTAVYKGELKAGELTSDAGRLRMKELFKERLKANK